MASLKRSAHAAGADAHEHLDKVGTRDAKERHARLAATALAVASYRYPEGPTQQNAARNLGTQFAIAVPDAQEVANLLELLDGLVHAGNVLELDLGTCGLVGLGIGLAKLHVPIIGCPSSGSIK